MLSVNVFCGVLRVQARSPRPPAIHCVLRSLSFTTTSSRAFLPYARRLQPTPSQLIYTRHLSLASVFAPRKPAPTPAPAIVARIATLEADANAHPESLYKQLALFDALVASGVKPAYDVVIARWERTCEFDPANLLLQSDKAFEFYLTALLRTGLESSIAPAVRRRDTILATHAPAAASATAPAPVASVDSAAVASGTGTGTSASANPTSASASVSANPASDSATATPAPPTASQQLAQAVLGGHVPSAGLGSPHADMAKLALALGAGAGVPGNPLTVQLYEPKGSWVPRFLRFVTVSVILTFLVIVTMSVMLENSGLLKAGPVQPEFEPMQGKTYRFSDVHGVDEAKNELQEVVEFLKDPSSFATLGGKLPKGILLTGPPGTGKTMLARAVAGEAGVPFLFASGSDFDEMFVGVGAKRVRELFAAARKRQPAIVFIDELDAVGGKRSSRDQQYMKQTLNQLLVEMDGFMQTEGVIVIAATNFPDALDDALVRPGRFDRHIAVPLPDVRGRVQILKHHMKDVVTAPEVDVTILARGTSGFSGADLQNMVNQAAVEAARQRASAVTLKHFEWAKDRIAMGAERKSTYISDEVKKMTAYHEGGHALVALYTEGAMPLHKVTCMPRGHALGITSQLPQDDRYSVSFKEYLAHIDVCMGGRVAEEIVYGPENVTSGASSDLQKATQIARSMVKNWGFSTKIGPVYYSDRDETISPHKRDEIEGEVRGLLTAGETRVVTLLKAKEEELHRLATALVEHETLDAEEVRKVIKGEPIRNITEMIKEDISRMSADTAVEP